MGGVGSGTADVKGNGEFLDARSVNERIVTFESNQIGALIPRGIVDDPWDYEVIHKGVRIMSNPEVVNDIVYFISTDGLLWSTDGVSVEEARSSLDVTKFDDFDEKKPIWLTYSEEINSLLVYYASEATDNMYFYTVSLANGGVAKHKLFPADDALAKRPRGILSIENSDTRPIYLARAAESTDTDLLPLAELKTGNPVGGIDKVTTNDTDYWEGMIETGNIFLEDEGVKCALKHIIVDTYCDTTSSSNNPYIAVEVKSLEDDEWHYCGDVNLDEQISVNNSNNSATLNKYGGPGFNEPEGVFSYKLTNNASGANQTFGLPWVAGNCRYYSETGGTYTEMTEVSAVPTGNDEYYPSGNVVVVRAAGGRSIYCYSENEPAIVLETDDHIKTGDDRWFRAETVTDYDSIAMDRASDTSSDSCSHRATQQIASGSGQVKLGINKNVEGFQIRLYVIPRRGSGITSITTQPSVAKITGISFGYIPLSKKTLEATGS
jgi:hypothetical protein